jgi:flagellar hook-associated protein 2
VRQADPGATIGIDVATDTSAFVDKITAFVAAYNDIVGFLEAQRVSAGTGDNRSIGNDPLLRQLRSNLRSALLGSHGDGTVTHLTEVGVEFTRDGKLKLERSTFEAALAAHGDDLRALFAGPSGAFPAVESMLDEYTNAAGFIWSAKDRLNRQIGLMDSQILAMQSRLAFQREALQRQFTEADAAMSRLKNQSGALADLGI